VAREAEMPGEVRVECLRCHHVGRVTALDLARRGIKPSAPIASFIKRLRCRKCGSQSVRAERVAGKRAG
jgi:phage FluMu protein Com